MTQQQCWQPQGMVRAVDLPDDLWRKLAQRAARMAVCGDDVVTIVGAAPRVGDKLSGWTALFCRLSCRFEHIGSVVAIPDILMIEMAADGDVPATQIERLPGGRSAWLYRIP